MEARRKATIAQARSLRSRQIEPEAKLWGRLRNRRLGGHEFLRQVPIGAYVADFVCREGGLIVEVDGSGHARSDRDGQRDAYLVRIGFSVLRFWNGEVASGLDDVCETIIAALDGRLSAHDRFLKAS